MLFSFFIIWFLFVYLVHERDWGILFWKILSKCFSEKDINHFCLAWKLFEYPLIKFNNFKPSFFKFFYSSLFCFYDFTCFRMLVIFFEDISLQVHFEIISIHTFLYTYMHKYTVVFTQSAKEISINLSLDSE